MFRAMFSAIIKSTRLNLQYLLYSPKLLPAGVLDEFQLIQDIQVLLMMGENIARKL
jgi:hypothetical protein